MQPYPPNIEQKMLKFYNSLSEKDRRHYAAIEALKLGWGGITYICQLFGCYRATVSDGIEELEGEEVLGIKKIRRDGGGRKSAFETINGLDEAFLKIIAQNTAGSPMDEKIKWTNLNRQEISELLQADGLTVSVTVVDQLLEKHHYRRRKAQKRLSTGQHPQRNEQFENIEQLVEEYQAKGNPVISMDTKKKELIGSLYREGKLYSQSEIEVFDHDWPSLAEGVVIPHGLYDLSQNKGYIQIGTSHDTSEFACDSLWYWWKNYGFKHYKLADSILVLCDGGGSNGSRNYLFKQDLQYLVDELGIEIRIAHYPPYTSKYNPIEHRLFPHVTRACQGVIFKSVEIVEELIAKTNTKTGLEVFTTILDGVYEVGRKVTKEFKETMKILFDQYLPKWNYTAVPQLL